MNRVGRVRQSVLVRGDSRGAAWLLFLALATGCVTSSTAGVGAPCETDRDCEPPLVCRAEVCAARAPSADVTEPSSAEEPFRGPPQAPTTRTGGGASTAIPGNSCVRAPLDDYAPYGWEENVPANGGLHLGEDSVAAAGTPVYAVATGPVTYSENRRPAGPVCCGASQCATNWGGLVYQNVTVAGVTVTIAYGHLDATALPRAGQVVNRGERIGVVADCSQTGFFTHLHVQMTTDGRTLPATYTAALGGMSPPRRGGSRSRPGPSGSRPCRSVRRRGCLRAPRSWPLRTTRRSTRAPTSPTSGTTTASRIRCSSRGGTASRPAVPAWRMGSRRSSRLRGAGARWRSRPANTAGRCTTRIRAARPTVGAPLPRAW